MDSSATRCNFVFDTFTAPKRFKAKTTEDLLIGHTATLIGGFIVVLGRLGQRRPNYGPVLFVGYRKNVWTWRNLDEDTQGPYPQYHTSVVVADRLYTFGGRDDADLLSDGDMWMLDVVTMDWIPCNSYGNRPPHLAGHTCDIVERSKELVVFGGRHLSGRFATFVSNQVFVYDIRSRIWNKPEIKGRLPMKRYLHSSCVARRRVFIWGGAGERNDNALFDMNILQPSSTVYTWSQPAVRGSLNSGYSATLSYFKGKLIRFGGITAFGFGSRDAFAYDPIVQEWEELKYVRGGQGLRSKNQILHQGYSFVGLSHHATVTTPDSLIIFGGHGHKSWREVYVLREHA